MTKDKEEKQEKVETPQPVGEYAELYQQAKENNHTKQLTAQYFEFNAPGRGFVGKFISKHSVTSGLNQTNYYQYLFHTDEGLIKCAFGNATDAEAGSLMKEGCIYAVHFMGSEKITGGRRVNKFDIAQILTAEDFRVGGDDDQSF